MLASMTDGARGWILWVALAVMSAESIVSLAPVVSSMFATARKQYSRRHLDNNDEDEEDEEVETADRLVPLKWIAWGAGASIVLGTVLVWVVFGSEGISPWATVIGFLLGSVLSLLGLVFLSFLC